MIAWMYFFKKARYLYIYVLKCLSVYVCALEVWRYRWCTDGIGGALYRNGFQSQFFTLRWQYVTAKPLNFCREVRLILNAFISSCKKRRILIFILNFQKYVFQKITL